MYVPMYVERTYENDYVILYVMDFFISKSEFQIGYMEK